MEKNKRLANSGINITIRYLLNQQGRSVNDLCRVLYKKRSRTYAYLRNPCLMNVQQIILVAGFLRVDYCGLFLAVFGGRPFDKMKEDGTLSELLRSVPESLIEEDK